MGNDFETDKNYNFEKNVSMIVELNKTCYSSGEIITGTIILSAKEGLIQTQLLNPYAMITLEEKHYYEYTEMVYDYINKKSTSKKKIEQENKPLLSIPMDFSNFIGANILTGIQIPFQFKIPETAYPSCFFDSTTYVKHFLILDFHSIGARKTNIIVIKNNIYFSNYNGLLKAPASYSKEITKYKYGFFNYGSFNATATLPKNIFSYNEDIPFLIDIECPKLSIAIKSLRIVIYRVERKNYQKDHKVRRSKRKMEIINKIIPLTKGETIYHIEDVIKLPHSPVDLNPKEVYLILDKDKRKVGEKFKNVLLFPSCYNGLLTCQYYIDIIFEMDTWFSSNEKFKIPLDFYEPFISMDNSNEKSFYQKNNIYNTSLNNNNYQKPTIYNNEFNSQQIPQIFPSECQTPQNNEVNINDYELPNEEEIYSQKKNNDGSAPPPNAI